MLSPDSCKQNANLKKSKTAKNREHFVKGPLVLTALNLPPPLQKKKT